MVRPTSSTMAKAALYTAGEAVDSRAHAEDSRWRPDRVARVTHGGGVVLGSCPRRVLDFVDQARLLRAPSSATRPPLNRASASFVWPVRANPRKPGSGRNRKPRPEPAPAAVGVLCARKKRKKRAADPAHTRQRER